MTNCVEQYRITGNGVHPSGWCGQIPMMMVLAGCMVGRKERTHETAAVTSGCCALSMSLLTINVLVSS